MSGVLRVLILLLVCGASAGCSLLGGLGDYDTDCETDWHGSLAPAPLKLVPGVEDALSQFTGVLVGDDVVLVASRGTAGFPVRAEAFGVKLGQSSASTMPVTEPIEQGLNEVALSHVAPFVWLVSAGSDVCGGPLCLARGSTPLRPQDVLQANWLPMRLAEEERNGSRFHRPAVAGIDAGDDGRHALVTFVADGGSVHVAWLEEAAFVRTEVTPGATRALDRMRGDYEQPQVAPWSVDGDAGFVVAYRSAAGDCADGVRVWRFGLLPPSDDDGRLETCIMPKQGKVDEVSLTLVQRAAIVGMRAQDEASFAMLPVDGRWSARSEPVVEALDGAGRVRVGPALHATSGGDVLATWVAPEDGSLVVQAQRFHFEADAEPQALVALERIHLGSVKNPARVFVRYDGAKACVAVTSGPYEAELTLGKLSCASP